MKYLSACFLVSLFLLKAQAQSVNWFWAKSGIMKNMHSVNTPDHLYSKSIATDYKNNIYIGGDFIEPLTFENITLQTPYHSVSVFLAKYNAEGNLLWAKKYGLSRDEVINGIEADVYGNVVVTGMYQYPDSFGSFALTPHPGGGHYEPFLMKVDSNGSVLWAKGIGTTGYNETISKPAIDTAGNIYICGTFNDSCFFNGVPLVSAGASDVFLAKYDSSGNVDWVRRDGSGNAEYAANISLTDSGRIYVCGTFENSTSLSGFSLTGAAKNAFLAKYENDGSNIMVQSLPNTAGHSVGADAAGNIYWTGMFSDTLHIAGQKIFSTYNTHNNIFIAKYDPALQLQWVTPVYARNFSGVSHTSTDDNGNTFIGGGMVDSTYIQGSFLGHRGAFLAKWDANGKLAWSYNDAAYSIVSQVCLDKDDNVCISGEFFGDITFGNETLLCDPLQNQSGIYIAKASPFGLNIQPQENKTEVRVYPNPALQHLIVEAPGLQHGRLCITDINGRVVYTGELDNVTSNIPVSGMPRGVYILKISGPAPQVYIRKIVLQ